MGRFLVLVVFLLAGCSSENQKHHKYEFRGHFISGGKVFKYEGDFVNRCGAIDTAAEIEQAERMIAEKISLKYKEPGAFKIDSWSVIGSQ